MSSPGVPLERRARSSCPIVPPPLNPALTCAKWICFHCKLILPDSSIKRKGSSENRNAIWKTCNWRKIFEASKRNQFQDCCQCSLWVCNISALIFCKKRWVDKFLVRINATDRSIMQRVKSYRCTLANNLPLSGKNMLSELH